MKLRTLVIMLTIAVFGVLVLAPAAYAAKPPTVKITSCPKSAKHGVKFTVKGSVTPKTSAQAKSNNPVKILRLVNGTWKKIAGASIVWSPYGIGGTFKAKVTAGAKGTKMKIKASWTAAKLTGFSKIFTVTVK